MCPIVYMRTLCIYVSPCVRIYRKLNITIDAFECDWFVRFMFRFYKSIFIVLEFDVCANDRTYARIWERWEQDTNNWMEYIEWRILMISKAVGATLKPFHTYINLLHTLNVLRMEFLCMLPLSLLKRLYIHYWYTIKDNNKSCMRHCNIIVIEFRWNGIWMILPIMYYKVILWT